MFPFMHYGKEGLVAFASSEELCDSSLAVTRDLEVIRINDNPVDLVQLVVANEEVDVDVGFFCSLGSLGVLWWMGWLRVVVS